MPVFGQTRAALAAAGALAVAGCASSPVVNGDPATAPSPPAMPDPPVPTQAPEAASAQAALAALEAELNAVLKAIRATVSDEPSMRAELAESLGHAARRLTFDDLVHRAHSPAQASARRSQAGSGQGEA